MSQFRYRAVLGLVVGLAVTSVAVPTALADTVQNPDSVAPKVTQTYCGYGTWARSTTPAAGFSPLTATADELEANGYPPRPSQDQAGTRSAAYVQWQRLVTTPGITHTSCKGLRVVAATGGSSRRGARTGATAVANSTNWAGYVAHNATFSEAEAEWTEPVANGVPGTDDYSSSWVGIGLGQSSANPLMQAGSEADYLNGNPRYYLWMQSFPNQNQQLLVDEVVDPGDLVGAHVTYTAGGPLFHIWDKTLGFNGTFTIPESVGNDGHAEWIYERTLQNGKRPFLADAPPTFTSAQAVTGGAWHPLGSLSDIAMTMFNCPFTEELGTPGGFFNNGFDFTANYLHHGDSGVC